MPDGSAVDALVDVSDDVRAGDAGDSDALVVDGGGDVGFDTGADAGADGGPGEVSTSCWIEGESVTSIADDWVVDTSLVGFQGTGYLAYTAGRSRDQDRFMTFTIHVPEDGRYWIQMRGRRDRGVYACPAGAAEDACNDLFSRVNDESWEKTMMKRAQYGDDDGGSGDWSNWYWDGRLVERAEQRPLHDLSAGEVTLSISGRSEGIAVDAIAVFLEGDERPGPDARDCTVPF